MRNSLLRNRLPWILWAALVLTGEACSPDDPPGQADAAGEDGAGARGAGGAHGDASAGSGGTGGIVIATGGAGPGGAAGQGCVEAGAPPDPRYEFPTRPPRVRPCCDFYIELPPEGTPAMIDSVCTDSGGPVQSAWAARVTLIGGLTPPLEGRVVMARALADRVVGLPSVQAIDASDPGWKDMIIGNMQARPAGDFTFNFAWPNLPASRQDVRISLETSFSVQCAGEAGVDAGSTRTVQAVTNVLRCPSGAGSWVSSGDICALCGTGWGEFAPTRAVPAAP